MSIIVTDNGFAADDWSAGFVGPEWLGNGFRLGSGVCIGCDTAPEKLRRWLPDIGMIRIRFAHFHEARGFDLARCLRAMGFAGRLRAKGHVLAHQYTMARRVGFDEVEISAELALRQPAEHWRFRGNWCHAEFHSMMPA